MKASSFPIFFPTLYNDLSATIHRESQAMFTFFTFMLVIYSEFAGSTLLENRSEDGMKNIFILAGQSNMAGRGGVVENKWDGIVPTECQPSKGILRLSGDLGWEEAREPLHRDIDVNHACGVGPGMSFANAIREMDPSIGIVGLVPCAVGGTNISEWNRGMSLYNELVKRANVAVEGGRRRIRAVLWYQGESDTVSRVDAESYQVHMERFIEGLRYDLQAPQLPIIQVALASGQGAFVDRVRKAQLLLYLSNVRCVDAKGLQLEPDGLHLTTPSQVRLGQLLAQEFIKTLQYPIPIVHNISPNTRNISFYFIIFTCLVIVIIIIL